MEKEVKQESFEEFIKSFFYGRRSDLSFKFISDLSQQQASQFIVKLFEDIVDAVDDDDLEKIKQSVLEGQIKGYREQKKFDYDSGPFQKPAGPVSQLKLSLLTSSGHFVKGDDPKPFGIENMTQQEAETRVFDFLKQPPQLSQIPFNTAPENLLVRHGGYDTRAANKDPNVSFPYQAMVSAKDEGTIGDLTGSAYSFVGACSQIRLKKETLPGWLPIFKEQHTDALVLVPV